MDEDKTYFLVAVDVSGIQEYVFRSNDLGHHLGASELTRLATNEWVYDELPNPNNIKNGKILDGKYIENGDVVCEVILSGGGNALALFTNEADAKLFTQKLSRKILLDAPGLIVHIVRKEFVWKKNGNDLGMAVSNLLGVEMRQRKQAAQPNGRMLGLSVTADCEFTGLPAVEIDKKEERRVSAEIKAKLKCAGQSDARLKTEIGGEDYVRNFNELGTLGESSYLAVIHADGNRMGQRFEKLSKAGLTNRGYISAVRKLSESVNKASLEALKATTSAIRNAIEKGKIGDAVVVHNNKIPFRPIIFGGDDATFVCDGRLGLSVAAKYLQEFEKQMLDEPDGKTHPTARAGIAIVKNHYPFGQAYHLAAKLAESAKNYTDNGAYSAMDWHFGVNGVVMELENMRKRDYIVANKERDCLLMRPVRLQFDANNWRTWAVFFDITHKIQNSKSYPKNKITAFREALRGGPGKARAFINSYFRDLKNNLMLPAVTGYDAQSGWIGERCAYFDPIEAMEFFVHLEPKKRNSP